MSPVEEVRLEVKPLRRAMRVSRRVLEEVKEISPRILRKMRREAVDCPVKRKTVAFLECFTCPNFLRRFKGNVYCKGESL